MSLSGVNLLAGLANTFIGFEAVHRLSADHYSNITGSLISLGNVRHEYRAYDSARAVLPHLSSTALRRENILLWPENHEP